MPYGSHGLPLADFMDLLSRVDTLSLLGDLTRHATGGCQFVLGQPLTGQLQLGIMFGMNDRSDRDRVAGALRRIRQAAADRENEVQMAHRRFWTRVGSEIAAGLISQAEAARFLGVTRETLRLRTRQYVPDAPVRPRGIYPLFLAVNMRLRGEREWRCQSEHGDDLDVVTMPFRGASSPYAGHVLDFAYREVDEPPSHSLGFPPIFSAPGISPRPLYFSEAVEDELFGPRNMASSARRAWEERVSQLPTPDVADHVDQGDARNSAGPDGP